MASSRQGDSPWWKREGFTAAPRPVFADGGEIVYRTWGGKSQKLSKFFLRPKPRTRIEAEQLCSVFEYGNSCIYVTTFRVHAGTPMHVGRVHPGDSSDPNWSDPRALQIYIANPVGAVAEVKTEVLQDDLGPFWVSTSSGNA